jgi:hypothetical protein
MTLRIDPDVTTCQLVELIAQGHGLAEDSDGIIRMRLSKAE